MPRFNPLPKVKALSCDRKMNQVDLQTLIGNFAAMEERLTVLQEQNDELSQILQQQQQQHNSFVPTEPSVRFQNDMFRIPDPLKTIPTFDGNKKHLISWIATAQKILNMFKPIVSVQVYEMYVQAVINKIEGKARDTLCVNGNPTTFEEIVEILTNSFGDKRDMATYQTQLWTMKMDESIHVYYKRTKEIAHNMKALAKQKDLYRNSWQAINDFIDQECLAAFIKGLSKQYFGYVQAAKPEDLETAYSFLCKFQNSEQTKKITENSNAFNKSKPTPFVPKTGNSNHPSSGSVKNTFSHKQKPIPMEIDQSMRSRDKIFAHTAEDGDSDCDNEENELESANFQMASVQLDPR